jgi:hypothetical protein
MPRRDMGWQAQMAKDLDDDRGSSVAAMIFKAPPQLGQCSISMSKTRLSSRTQLMRGISPWAGA